MASDDPQKHVGMRFSLFYQNARSPVRDDERMRRRLARALYEMCYETGKLDYINSLIPSELGVDGILLSKSASGWDSYFGKADLTTVLDLPSLVFRAVSRDQPTAYWRDLRSRINRIFSETQVTYVCDERGGVRYSVDEAFEANRVSSIAALSGIRYSAARVHIDAADAAMTAGDMRQAIQKVFDAAENLFKQMTEKDRLTKAFAVQELDKVIQAAYRSDPHAITSAMKARASFGEWVDSAHFYRHERGQPEPHQPPDDFAVLLISQGLSFVRWLATLDTASETLKASAT